VVALLVADWAQRPDAIIVLPSRDSDIDYPTGSARKSVGV